MEIYTFLSSTVDLRDSFFFFGWSLDTVVIQVEPDVISKNRKGHFIAQEKVNWNGIGNYFYQYV